VVRATNFVIPFIILVYRETRVNAELKLRFFNITVYPGVAA
jgi:hypothetical protein